LTASKKEQAKLRTFSEHLPEFQKYLLSQGDNFLNVLNI
jgi:hypothetical protein